MNADFHECVAVGDEAGAVGDPHVPPTQEVILTSIILITDIVVDSQQISRADQLPENIKRYLLSFCHLHFESTSITWCQLDDDFHCVDVGLPLLLVTCGS